MTDNEIDLLEAALGFVMDDCSVRDVNEAGKKVIIDRMPQEMKDAYVNYQKALRTLEILKSRNCYVDLVLTDYAKEEAAK